MKKIIRIECQNDQEAVRVCEILKLIGYAGEVETRILPNAEKMRFDAYGAMGLGAGPRVTLTLMIDNESLVYLKLAVTDCDITTIDYT